MIDELIPRFRALDLPFNPPASPERCVALSRALACELPAEILALYRDHDGTGGNRGDVPFRLMSIDEAMEFHGFSKGLDEQYGLELRFFWTDDNSNYAGLFVGDPLEGRVCIIDHEDVDLSPDYRSLRSFLEVMLDAAAEGLDWCEMPTDYPVDRTGLTPEVRPSSAIEQHADWAVAQSLIPDLGSRTDDDRKRYLTYCIMALTPPDHANDLLLFMDDENMWMQ